MSLAERNKLADREIRGYEHLDPMASAAWRILDQPRSSEEVVRLFQAAFPDAPRRKIAKDVGRLIESLEDRGLIARAAAPDRTDRTGDASA
jgi:Coenzyme PQQ synthesis protein D (PqqD)